MTVALFLTVQSIQITFLRDCRVFDSVTQLKRSSTKREVWECVRPELTTSRLNKCWSMWRRKHSFWEKRLESLINKFSYQATTNPLLELEWKRFLCSEQQLPGVWLSRVRGVFVCFTKRYDQWGGWSIHSFLFCLEILGLHHPPSLVLSPISTDGRPFTSGRAHSLHLASQTATEAPVCSLGLFGQIWAR